MSKIHPINAKWDAVAALSCALEETEPDEQVIVRKKESHQYGWLAPAQRPTPKPQRTKLLEVLNEAE